VSAFFDAVRVRSVETKDLRRHDPELRSLRNVNTPAELAALAALPSLEAPLDPPPDPPPDTSGNAC
jgi:hypothetical protein